MKPFLTASWSHLAMLNYEIDPQALRPYVPAHTELDEFDHRHFVSMVGFLYDNTKVLGIAVPGHRRFCEVNLRFYVRYRAREGWRRGVAFIKETVPRRAVAWIAREWYEEKFVFAPMRYQILPAEEDSASPKHVEYSWYHQGEWQRLAVDVTKDAALPADGSQEEFITEHYWGYTARRDGSTSEYQVSHPQWKVRQAATAALECNVAKMYGEDFVEALLGTPSSVFLAEGSDVAVFPGHKIVANSSREAPVSNRQYAGV